jgi:hypothetical protein
MKKKTDPSEKSVLTKPLFQLADNLSRVGAARYAKKKPTANGKHMLENK